MTFGYGFEKNNPANQFVKDVQNGVQSSVLSHIATFGVDITDKFGNTPLHWAAANGRIEIINMLTQAGVPVNKCNAFGVPPVFYAAYHGDPETIVALVELKAKLDVKDVSGHGILHYAAWNGSPEAIHTLSSFFKIPVDSLSSFGRTPLMYSTHNIDNMLTLLDNDAKIDLQDNDGTHVLHWAVIQGSGESIKELVKSGAPLEVTAKSGGTPLSFAAAGGHIEEIKTLIELGAKVEHKGNAGATPLILAAKNGHLECVKELIEKGKANVNNKSSAGATAIHAAIRNGHEAIVNLLVDNGADLSVVDSFGDTPVLLAVAVNNLPFLTTAAKKGVQLYETGKTGAIHFAVNQNNLEAVRHLISLGVPVDTPDENDFTPLFYASVLGHIEILEWLLKEGANINAVAQLGRSPLHYAKNSAVVETLIRGGLNVDVKDLEDNTPLATASASGSLEVMEALIKAGAKIDEMDLEGRTPLHIATHFENIESVKKLLELGVPVTQPNKDGDPPIITALKAKKTNMVKELLQLGASANSLSGNGQPAFFYAKDLEALKILLDSKSGINLETKSNSGDTFLHYLCRTDQAQLATEVVKMGANVNTKNSFGITPLFYACNNIQLTKDLIMAGSDFKAIDKHGNTLLHFSAQNANNTEILSELVALGLSVESRNTGGQQPTFSAVFNSNIQAIKKFVELGANVNDRDSTNNSLLHFAMFQKSEEVVKELVKLGCDLEAKNSGGWTPIVAAAYDNYSYIPLLVELGSNLESEDTEGNTPLMKMVQLKRVEGIKALIKAGAKKDKRDKEGLLPAEVAKKVGLDEEIVKLLN